MLVNQLKHLGADGVNLQITKPTQRAGLVEETEDADVTQLASVRIFTFDDLLLVADRDQIRSETLVELVVAAAQDTGSIYRSRDPSIQIADNGY